jgi:hypothetical protein
MSRGVCEVCKAPVTTVETAAYPITGWVAERKGGGTNAVINKLVVPDRIAHAVCVRLVGKKNQGQMSF